MKLHPGILAVVLVGLLGWAGWNMYRAYSSAPGGIPGENNPRSFVCGTCQHAFQLRPSEMVKRYQGEDFCTVLQGRAHCPKCKGQFCAQRVLPAGSPPPPPSSQGRVRRQRS
ncbi:MAG: hypothetical protein NTV49_04620 [Kiritimatiellaeota bacterium]|nr:hypothetical protein [Kiritimatiellota bacterium]